MGAKYTLYETLMPIRNGNTLLYVPVTERKKYE